MLSIGAVLTALQDDYPGITISKIRFLEAEGLVDPSRSPSGYRRFSAHDVERLRYVLTAQQRHFLPLKVIRQHLDALDRGLEPPPLAEVAPRVPEAEVVASAPSLLAEPTAVRLNRRELLSEAELDEALLGELEAHGFVAATGPGPGSRGDVTYGMEALEVARIAGLMSRHGIQPRHLRALRTSAEREA